MNEMSKKPDVQSHAKERGTFKALLLSNPNYFGTLAESQFKPVLPLCCNQHYETLKDVGYHPQQERLEAVVYINQPSGYSGDVCGSGSTEYVRFYLSFDKGKTWEDQGLTSFQAYNVAEIKDGRHLEYAVSLPVAPKPKFCLFDPLIKVRAILSWNYAPPENQPDWKPVWGNSILEKDIVVEPFRRIIWYDLFKAVKIDLPPLLKEIIDPEESVLTKQKVLSATELAVQYKELDVPPHRFAFKEIHSFVSAKTSLSTEAVMELLSGIKIDIAALLSPETDGNTSYEELMSIGLDPNCPDTLVGVIQVKKPAGYSGGLCTNGSLEHVTFWADFDGNGSFETCLGTASVHVYDLQDFPKAGVWYAVRLPVDLDKYRRHCKRGPNVVPIRAILSWNVPASSNNPDYRPFWGNREETLISIGPGISKPAGKIAILGGIPVDDIYDKGATDEKGQVVEGLTTPEAVFATNNSKPDAYGRTCPFAGRVTVQGAPMEGFSYKVEVIPADGGAAIPVVTDLVLTNQYGKTYIHKADPATGRFSYVRFEDNINGLLAQWDSNGDAKWIVRLISFNGNGQAGVADEHLIQLDNTWPEAAIEITSGAGNCGKFKMDVVIEGSFVANDKYLGSYNLYIEPDVNDPDALPNPKSGTDNTAFTGNKWELKTEGMIPCGYVVRLDVSDRAIVNSQGVGHSASASAGFCLEK